MAASWRQGIFFGLGLLAGVLASVSLLSGFKAQPAGAAAAPAARTAAATPYCGFDALLPAKERADQFGVPMDASGKDIGDVPAYIAVGEDVRGKGRARDAEIAFITACRIAGQLKGPDSVEIAGAKFHLASLYSQAAGTGALRAEALQRADTLMAESVTTYGAKLGMTDEKTALAAGGLARIKTAMLEAEEPSGVPRVLLAERQSPDYGVAVAATTTAMGAARARKEEPETAAVSPVVPAPEAPAPASVAAVKPQAPPPVNVPTCLGGDCPDQARMVRDRERDREPLPSMQASRKLTLPEAVRAAPPVSASPPSAAVGQAEGSATASPGDPFAP